MRFLKIFLLTFIIFSQLTALHLQEKVTSAVRTTNAPKIDGSFEDLVWQDLPTLTDFVQIRPYNGSAPSQITIVKTTYDNNAIYIMAKMFDQPDSIYRELGHRDSYDRISSDLFEIQITPYEDGLVSYFFSVSASGVQSDLVYSPEGRDKSSDSVWESATLIVDDGWSAEIKIPYSALRFPSKDVQNWGINFYRTVKRNEEKSSWNYVSNDIDQWWTQTGKVKNLHKIDPPLRLSFMPYVSGYLEKNEYGQGTSYNGGMDMKFGINESFTVDMTLIPDFGQVQADDQVLNLSPFEIRYDEKRQFFTEASELFSKGNIFYSRRIGSSPRKYWNAYDDLGENEDVLSSTDKTQLINATKLSGRTQGGLGVGVFNAMTKAAYSTIEDTLSGESHKYKTQDFTNYNLTVFDQSLKNNSYISLANSNMYSSDYMADVVATEFRFFSSNLLYSLRGNGAVSNQREYGDLDQGFKYSLLAGKTNGALQYQYDYSAISDTYDPNDMGFLRQNNRINHEVEVSHRTLKPFSFFNSMYNKFSIKYDEQFHPKKYMSFNLGYEIFVSLKNHNRAWINLEWMPLERNNFAEPRVDDRYFKKPKGYSIFSGFRTNRNNFYSVNLRGGIFRTYNSNRDQLWSSINITQSAKFSNQFNMHYSVRINNDLNDYGYVDYMDDNDIIFFGRRNVKSLTNTIESNYMFTGKSSLNFRLRHYWSSAKYDNFFTLQDNGYLQDTDEYSENPNINFNAFNIDMVYNWNFAPGSELSLVWKNAISLFGDEVIYNPFQNFRDTFDSPQTNSISLKVLYYLDYLNLKKYTNA